MPELVVHGLLAHSHTGRELRGPQALRARVLEYEEVRLVEVVEAVLVEPLQHVPPHDLEWSTQERTDERRARDRRGRCLSKAT